MGRTLNLPILQELEACESILIAGAGGGFDIFSGLPIYFTLRDMGKTVHLANYSFSDIGIIEAVGKTETLIEDLVIAAKGGVRLPLNYIPEQYLAQWFKEVRNEDIPIWIFDNTGAIPLKEAYEHLVEHLAIDAIILIDGGVDSLMRGDEEGAGSILEDSISIIAVNQLDVPVKILASIGFGTEVEEQVCHYHALENMATLTKLGAFLGSCALTPDMPAFELFEQAARYTWEQPKHSKSHISTRIVPAVHGEFGNHHMYYHERATSIFVSPLMGLYWFFDVDTVAEQNLLAQALKDSNSKDDALKITVNFIKDLVEVRRRRVIPY